MVGESDVDDVHRWNRQVVSCTDHVLCPACVLGCPGNVLSQTITTHQLGKLDGVRIRSALEPNMHVTGEDNGIGERRQAV